MSRSEEFHLGTQKSGDELPWGYLHDEDIQCPECTMKKPRSGLMMALLHKDRQDAGPNGEKCDDCGKQLVHPSESRHRGLN